MIFRVAERSMEPAIKEGSYAVVWRLSGRLKPGTVVVLRHPSKEIWIIKRIRDVDGKSACVVGDNTSKSEDSRKFGRVNLDRIAGRVIFAV